MAPTPPEGFVATDLGPGYGHGFGPVYLDGRGRIGFFVTASHVNQAGSCHGGAMSTFADQQLLALLPARDGPVEVNPTINLSVDYLAPAPLGAWVEATATLVRLTRTMIFTQAVMTVDGEPVARSTAIYRRNKTLETFG